MMNDHNGYIRPLSWTALIVLLVFLTAAASCDKENGSAASSAADLPAATEIAVPLAGGEKKMTGKLAAGSGFALYVFEGTSFNGMLSLLTFDTDKRVYAHVETLPADYKLDEIRKNAEAGLSKVGKVSEITGTELPRALGEAELMLTGGNDMLVQQVIVKKVGGTSYRIDLNLPQNRASEDFKPLAYASIGSLAKQ